MFDSVYIPNTYAYTRPPYLCIIPSCPSGCLLDHYGETDAKSSILRPVTSLTLPPSLLNGDPLTYGSDWKCCVDQGLLLRVCVCVCVTSEGVVNPVVFVWR